MAAFFEPFKNSPLRNEVKLVDLDETRVGNDDSFDLMGDMTVESHTNEIDLIKTKQDNLSVTHNDDQMNMTIAVGGFKNVLSEMDALETKSCNEQTNDDDTIGRFFFNSASGNNIFSTFNDSDQHSACF